jgi:hypothetical protein
MSRTGIRSYEGFVSERGGLHDTSMAPRLLLAVAGVGGYKVNLSQYG